MPIKVLKGDLPGMTRRRNNWIKETEEWKAVTAKLSQGLKPAEYVEISFTPEMVTKTKNIGKLFKLYITKWMEDLHLEYDVVLRSQNGTPTVYVAGRVPHVS